MEKNIITFVLVNDPDYSEDHVDHVDPDDPDDPDDLNDHEDPDDPDKHEDPMTMMKVILWKELVLL